MLHKYTTNKKDKPEELQVTKVVKETPKVSVKKTSKCPNHKSHVRHCEDCEK